MMNHGQQDRHQRRKQRTRQKLQEAMLELVLEKGAEAISIQEITDRADLGRGTFYFHFDDKEDLLWSIVLDRIQATERQLLENFKGEMPEQPEYFAYLNMFRHVEQHADVYRLMLSSKGSQGVANRARDYLVQETLQDMENYGVFQDIGQPPEITAQIVIGLLFSLILWWLESKSETEVEEMASILYTTLHHQQPPSYRKL
jgi:AcrR family transcriptional regulator